VIFVYSGKGGVGKSTICVNLAYSLMRQGIKVGLFDGDLSGPSIPTMVRQLEVRPMHFENFKILPGNYGGVYVNSIGFICDPIEGGYWQGKYLEGVLQQLLFATSWYDSDILLIDMPPGVGAIHKAILSRLQGKALIVTTPQDLSYTDTIRAIEMLNRMKVDIVGVIENMAYFMCECGRTSAIFRGDTRKQLCERFNVPLLLQLPLDVEIPATSNAGDPFILAANQKRDYVEAFHALSLRIYLEYDSFKSIRPTG